MPFEFDYCHPPGTNVNTTNSGTNCWACTVAALCETDVSVLYQATMEVQNQAIQDRIKSVFASANIDADPYFMNGLNVASAAGNQGCGWLGISSLILQCLNAGQYAPLDYHRVGQNLATSHMVVVQRSPNPGSFYQIACCDFQRPVANQHLAFPPENGLNFIYRVWLRNTNDNARLRIKNSFGKIARGPREDTNDRPKKRQKIS